MAGYTELDYIEATGTQWINTGVTGSMFKVGDRVRAVVDRPSMGCICIGDEGTVCDISLFGETVSVGVDFDKEIGGHNCMGSARNLHGWWLRGSDIQLIEDYLESDEPLSECFSTTDLSDFLCGNAFKGR